MATSSNPIAILHLEDRPDDAAFVEYLLQTSGVNCSIDRVVDVRAFQSALIGSKYDVIVSDFSLPEHDGLYALEIAKRVQPETPFIFVSGMIGEDRAVESVQKGAADYILKDRISRLPIAIRRAVDEARLRIERRRDNQRIREQAMLLDHASDAIFACDGNFQITFCNKSAERLYGVRCDEVSGQTLERIVFGNDSSGFEAFRNAAVLKGTHSALRKRTGPQGADMFLLARWTVIRAADGSVEKALVVESDVTQEKTLESNLFRAQRMESIGSLAAGVAHDVNNSLTPILMGLELIKLQLNAEGDVARCIDMMRRSAEHCAQLVAQVVTFARGLKQQKGPVPLRPLLLDLRSVLGRLFPRSITLEMEVPVDLWMVHGDPTKLHQVIMNLAVNARDAMPHGGILRIQAKNIPPGTKLPEGSTADRSQLQLSVSDTGEGISEEALAKVFDPFFTTKLERGGTGLGLAIVQKVVEEHEGVISVRSKPGRGATFDILLPALPEASRPDAELRTEAPVEQSGEKILLIEDEAALREIMRRLLEDAGYRVTTASDGAAGVAAYFKLQHELDLIITDLGLPYLDGLELTKIVNHSNPSQRMLICTGTSDVNSDEMKKRNTMVLAKPFAPDRLLAAVRESVQRP